MKKILSGLLLFSLCACGGQRGNADVEQSLTVAKVKITNSVLPELLYGDGEDFAVKSELIKGGMRAVIVGVPYATLSRKNFRCL